MMVRSILGIAVLLGIAAPGLAVAQGAPPAPGPAAQPMSMPLSPSPTPVPGGDLQPMQPQPYGSYPQPPPPRRSPRGHGLTVEVGFGFGQLSITDGDVTEENSGGGGALAIGGWLSPNLAFTFRISGISYTNDDRPLEPVTIAKSFYGATVQYWFSNSLWVGGGLGGGQLQMKIDDGSDEVLFQESGVSADLRVGFTPLVWSQSSLNVSLEVSPLWLEDSSSTSMAVLLGYQYL